MQLRADFFAQFGPKSVFVGAPHGFRSAAIRHRIMFHDITKRGGL